MAVRSVFMVSVCGVSRPFRAPIATFRKQFGVMGGFNAYVVMFQLMDFGVNLMNSKSRAFSPAEKKKPWKSGLSFGRQLNRCSIVIFCVSSDARNSRCCLYLDNVCVDLHEKYRQ